MVRLLQMEELFRNLAVQTEGQVRELQADIQLGRELQADTQADMQLIRELQADTQADMQLIRELQVDMQYETGKYFMRIDDLWSTKNEDFEGSANKLVLREIHSDTVAWYKQYEKAGAPKRITNKRRGEPTFSYQEAIFPGRGEGKKNAAISLAHLIPRDRTCSLFYGNALSMISGYVPANNKKDCLNSAFLRHYLEGSETLTGIKRSPWNFLVLPGSHSHYFDHMEKGAVILLPIWDLERLWCPGQCYDVLVVASNESAYKWMGLQPNHINEKPWLAKATRQDIVSATEFLSNMVKALADQLANESHDFFNEATREQNKGLSVIVELRHSSSQTSGSSENGSNNSATDMDDSATSLPPRPREQQNKLCEFKNKLSALEKVRKQLQESGTVPVPKLSIGGDDGEAFQVLKVKYAEFLSKDELIPDPYLVTLKAAINWSALQEMKLLPACRCATVTEDESVSSISSLQEISVLQCEVDDSSVLSDSTEMEVWPVAVTP